jgi:hypothetical protein
VAVNLPVRIIVTLKRQAHRGTPVECDKEAEMTKFLTGLLALALFVPAIAFAQDKNQPMTNSQAQQQSANQAAADQMNGVDTSPVHTMTGMVSQGGKMFTSNNTTWTVSNPGALKNYDGQNVTARVVFNTDKNTIKINKVMSGGQ